jgi:hypothetical protein
MRVVTKQQQVHLRLMSTLPVRTHYQPQKEGGHVHFMPPEKTMALKRAIKKLKDAGKTTREMVGILGCSKQTVYNHLRRRTDY